MSRLFDRERGARSAALTLAGPQLCSGYPGHVIRESRITDLNWDSKLVSVLEDWQKRCVETPEAWLFANADTKRPVHGDAIQKDYLRPAGEKIGLQGVGWHSFGTPIER